VAKINVYLPDELAATVRAAGFPVSPVCQKALADAVRVVSRARKAIEAIRDPQYDPAEHPALEDRLSARMTPRLKTVFRLAGEAAGTGTRVGTGHLLLGVLDEGDNLGLRLLRALDIDVDELRAAVRETAPEEIAPEETVAGSEEKAHEETEAGYAGAGAEPSPLVNLTGPARQAIASALGAGIDFGHNYFGCEHLVLGLLADPDSVAGVTLRGFGADPASARRAIKAVFAGYAHARQTHGSADEVMRRLDAIERRLSSLGA
jgi:ATP-dependent Clp protease ATP-binding subunit ClpA